MATVKELADRFAAAVGGGGSDQLDGLVSPDAEFEVTGAGRFRGLDQFKAFNQGFLDAFPDARVTVDHETICGNTAVLEVTYSGTNTGPIRSPQGEIPATGRTMNLRGCAVIEVEGDVIVAHRGYFDQVDMMTQLGLMPAPGGSGG